MNDDIVKLSNENYTKIHILEQRVTRLESDMSDNKESHARIFSRFEPLELNNAITVNTIRNINDVLLEMKQDLIILKNTSHKKLEYIWQTAVGAAVGGGLMYFISKVLTDNIQ